MLLPDQVLPLLNHVDPDVRQHAAKYFDLLGPSAPPETAGELWRAIDAYGDQRTNIDTREQVRLLHALSRVPMDETYVDRTLALLGKPGLDSNSSFAASGVLTHLSVELQQKRLADILPVLTPAHRGHIEKRLSLIAVAAEELWHRLVQLAQTAAEAEDARAVDHAHAGLLVEALARHPDFAAPLAMAVLQDPQDRWWLEAWCSGLAGDIGYTPAIDLLIEKMKIDDADFLRQAAGEALSLMEPAVVVPKLESAYPSDDQFFRSDIAKAMGSTMHPLAEAALIRLLADEKDKSAATGIACALSDLCTTDGLEALRQLVLADCYDTTIDDVKELLVVSSLMAGFDFPELAKWKVEIHDPAYKAELRKNFLGSFGMTEQMVEMFRKYVENPKAFEASPEPEETARGLPPSQAALPYRREEPKIGRNDPCPCGSGKKYKKCCGK